MNAVNSTKTIISTIRKRASIFTFFLGLYAGFIIRDETQVPNLQLVDELIVEYQAKDRVLQRQKAEVLKKIEEMSNKGKK